MAVARPFRSMANSNFSLMPIIWASVKTGRPTVTLSHIKFRFRAAGRHRVLERDGIICGTNTSAEDGTSAPSSYRRVGRSSQCG
jgi:hypothetical protein